MEHAVAGFRKALASGEAGGDGDLDRADVRTGADRVLGVSRAAAPRAPQARGVHRAASRHGRSGRCPARLHPLDAARRPRRSRNGDHALDRNRRAIDPPRPRGVDQRPHPGTRATTPSPAAPSARRAARPSRRTACAPSRCACVRRPKVHTVRWRASRPRSAGGARATRSAPESDHGHRERARTGRADRRGAAADGGSRPRSPPTTISPTCTTSASSSGRACGGVRAARARAPSRRARARWPNRWSAIAASSTEPNHGSAPRLRTLETRRVHPNACMGYSERQYAERESHNRRGHKAHWVPEPFREDVEIEWTPLWSLTAEATRYLPTSFCYFGYRSPDPLFARADSNGCAAGSVPEEAVLQGLLELIERDAVALWWYNRLRRPAVDLESVDDPVRLGARCVTTASFGATSGRSTSPATSACRPLPRSRGGWTKPKRTSSTASAPISIPASRCHGR